jgi:hypothetical protein
MFVLDHGGVARTVAGTPLNVTVLFHRLVPKLLPAIFTVLPAAADDGVMPVIIGVGGILTAKLNTGKAWFPPTYQVCA